MSGQAIDSLPGFRRRIVVTPLADRVSAAVEDDYHCMAVTIHHDGRTATGIDAVMERAPWTTCPGAQQQLRQTFSGVSLDAFGARGEKTINCTHLHDMALLAADHAAEAEPLVYDVLVSDPADGVQQAELRRNGQTAMQWTLQGFELTEPPELAGETLLTIGKWIAGLAGDEREAARIFRWATMISHGRQLPMAEQSEATRFPANCHTFQPENAARAVRVGKIKDFTAGDGLPLERFPGLSAG